MLKNKKILLGITGSVAAYKAIDIIKGLKDAGASVQAIMTDASCRFITPLSIEIALGVKPIHGMFDHPLSHITLPAESDLMLVAPATANTIGKFSNGIADDLLSACFMAFRGKTVIAPAMNWRMYESPAMRRNLSALEGQGVIEVAPVSGRLACGEEGIGKLAPTDAIVEAALRALRDDDLRGKKVLVTAGPTREYLDNVRFLSNRSSGKMGYALAKMARRRGAEVVLISGPTALPAAEGVRVIHVTSARQMHKAVMSELGETWAVVMAAAVADFHPKTMAAGKLEKKSLSSIDLELNPDIAADIGSMKKRPILVGFAAESGKNYIKAKEKYAKKGLDFIVFNDIDDPQSGFDVDTNRVVIIDGKRTEELPLQTKEEVADAILNRIAKLKA